MRTSNTASWWRGWAKSAKAVVATMDITAAAPRPLVMHKVFPDGKEELVRGAQFGELDLKTFKRVLAVGDKLAVINEGHGSSGSTIATPALVFEELDLAKIDEDFDKPPILPAPLARKAD